MAYSVLLQLVWKKRTSRSFKWLQKRKNFLKFIQDSSGEVALWPNSVTSSNNLAIGGIFQISSVQFSCSVVSVSLQPHGLQHVRFSCPSPTPGACSNSCTLSWWCHPTISSPVIPFSSLHSHSQHQGLFKWVSSSHQVAKVLEFQLQHQYFQWIFRTDFL